MRANSTGAGRRLLVCDRRVGAALKGALGAGVVRESSTVVVFDISECEAGARRAASRAGYRLGPRYMDRFYFCIASECDSERRLVVAQLFSGIAGEYENCVDVSRNRENAKNLLDVIGARTVGRGSVLDFGCGIGLAKIVGDRLGVELVGYEPSWEMRTRAIRLGMTVWGRRELELGELRAAMAGYVLHFPGVLSDLRAVWDALRPGGLLAANFHKSLGCDDVIAALSGWGAGGGTHSVAAGVASTW